MSLFDDVMTEVNKSAAEGAEKKDQAEEKVEEKTEPEKKTPEKKRFHEYGKDFKAFAGEREGGT